MCSCSFVRGSYTVSTSISGFDTLYTLTAKDGTELRFRDIGTSNVSAHLEAIFDAAENERRFTYYQSGTDVGKLQYITDIPTGNRSEFIYSGGLLDRIIDFAGRTIDYSHQGGNLNTIALPDPNAADSEPAPLLALGTCKVQAC